MDERVKVRGAHKPILPQMPEKGTPFEFDGRGETQYHSSVLCADFETLLQKCSEDEYGNIRVSHTRRPMSYGIYVKAADYVPMDLLDKYEIPQKPIICRGSETQHKTWPRGFWKRAVSIGNRVRELIKSNKGTIMSDEEKRAYSASVNCNLCGKHFRCSIEK